MLASHSSDYESSQLFYIYDPMCSWCYAFTQSWSSLQQVLSAQIQITYVLGGLAPDTTEPMSAAMRGMIQQTWRKIEETVPNIHFNYDFWAHNTPIRSTYPACRAIIAAEKQDSTASLAMFQAIQAAYYQQAKNPSLSETLQECARMVGLDSTRFVSDLLSGSTNAALQKELRMAARLHAFSFPSLRFVHQEKLYPITIDYLDYQKMLNEINVILNGGGLAVDKHHINLKDLYE